MNFFIHQTETQSSRTADEYASFLFPLLAHAGLSPTEIAGIALCSVVPPVSETFKSFCEKYLRLEPFLVNSHSKLGFKVLVDSPSEVGADRLSNTAYAVRFLKLPAIVVDLGTATTFDVVMG